MRVHPMKTLAALILGGCLLTGISCKQTKTGAAPQGDPLLPSTVSPPIAPAKTMSNVPADASAGHK